MLSKKKKKQFQIPNVIPALYIFYNINYIVGVIYILRKYRLFNSNYNNKTLYYVFTYTVVRIVR